MIARLARWRHLLLVLALAGLHMLVWERGLAGDGWGYFSTLESIIEDRDLDLGNNRYAVINGLSYNARVQRWVAQYPPGLALFDAPFYLAGKAAHALGWVRPQVDPGRMRSAYEGVDGQTLTRILFVVLAHNVYAALALVLIHASLRRLGFTPGWSALVTALCFFGSPLHFYAQNGMSHAVSCFMAAATAFVLAGICARPLGAARRWFWLGITVGGGAIVRYASGLLAVPAGLVLLLLEGGRWRRLFGRGLLFAAGMGAVIWILPLYLWLQVGEWFGSTYTPHWYFDPEAPPLYNVLLHARHGFLRYHPLFWLALAGIGVALLRTGAVSPAQRVFAGAGLAALVSLGTIYGVWFAWWGGASYSQRFLTDAVPFLAPGLAIFLTRGRRSWRVPLALALTAVSYLFFLLSNAGLAYDVIPYGPGQTLSDYRYVLDQGMTIAEIWDRITGESFSLPYLRRHAAPLIALLALLLAGYVALGRLAQGPPGGRRTPAEESA